MAAKGTGSLAIRAHGQATYFTKIVDFFSKKHPFSLNFNVLAQAWKKTPFPLKLGTIMRTIWHGELQDRASALTHTAGLFLA